MANQTGPASWNFGKIEAKPELTAEVVEAKAREIARQHIELLAAFGVTVNELAEAGDVLGLHCLSVAIKALLADAVNRCADIVDAVQIME